MNNDLLTIGSALAAGVIALATMLPKLLANFKRDKLDGAVSETQQSLVAGIQTSYEKQLTILTERCNIQDGRIDDMEKVSHTQAVKITRLVVVLIHMRGLLSMNNIAIPEFIKKEIDSLTDTDFDPSESKEP